jgi:hypothetical protein
MEAVDESVRVVQLSPQPVLVAAIVSGTANRCAPFTVSYRFDLLGDGGDLFVQRCEQFARLRRPCVFDHLRMVSSFLNVRALGAMTCTFSSG